MSFPLPLQLSLLLLSLWQPGDVHSLTVGCVGDSITQGVGASCPPCPTRGPLQPCGPQGCAHAWPAQLQRQLGADHRVLNWGHVAATMQRTTNCGDSDCEGRRCQAGPVLRPCKSNGPPYWVTREFARATNRTTSLDVVVIMLGTNDAKRNNWEALGNQSQFTSDATAMVATFLELPQKPRVFLSSPPPLYHATYTMNQTVVGTIMPRILRAVCAQHPGCSYIDMITPLGGWPSLNKPQFFLPNATNHGCDGDNPKQCKGDGCHPDDLGHAKIANAVARVLKL